MKIKNKFAKNTIAIMCIITTLCTGCTTQEEITVITPTEDVAITTEVTEQIEVEFEEQIDEQIEEKTEEKTEKTSITNQEDAHQLYQEFLEHIKDNIRYNIRRWELEGIYEDENEWRKIKESEFYGISYISDYMSNRMGWATEFNYALLDIDNNGIDELFLLENTDIVDVFNIVDGEIKRVTGSTGWKGYVTLLDNIKFIEYSNGVGNREANYYEYEFTDNELKMINCYAVRNYSLLETYHLVTLKLPVVDGEILWISETDWPQFIETPAFEEYLLDEQADKEFSDMIYYNIYVFDTIYPIDYL